MLKFLLRHIHFIQSYYNNGAIFSMYWLGPQTTSFPSSWFCLKEALSAAHAIEGLPVMEGNYQSAVSILHDRFRQKQNILSKHMDELLRSPPCNNKKSGPLRLVYNKIHVRGLKILGIDSGQYGSLGIPVMLSRVSIFIWT